MSDSAAAEQLRVLPDPAAALELLVGRYRKLVRSCVRRYSRGPEPVEDLMQVGYVGLLKAISNFDPARGFRLASYAEPPITGELKKHFRDRIWPVRVGRPLQERVLEVRQAELLLQPVSLDEPLPGWPGAASLPDRLGAEDPRREHMLGMQAIAAHWADT